MRRAERVRTVVTNEGIITLAEAVARFRTEAGFTSLYETHRRHAASSGYVFLGTRIPVRKDGHGRWVVQVADAERGLAAERERRERRDKVTVDYRGAVLHGTDGEHVETEWGYYLRRGPFHFRHNHAYDFPWKNDGSWICSTCWQPAMTEHEKDECHRCRDWSPCGRDCTLSAVRCDSCGTRLAF